MSAFGARRTTQAASDSHATTQTATPATSSTIAVATAGRGQATGSTAAPAEASGYDILEFENQKLLTIVDGEVVDLARH